MYKSLTDIRFLPVDLSAHDNVEPVPDSPAHHILVVDRSGSMYGDISTMRNMLIQMFAVDSMLKPSLRVSLLSFSSEGDCTLHFDNVPSSALSGMRYVDDINRIQATALTCISQGLEQALKFVVPHEITAITLLTDGYANDRSPFTEITKLKSFTETARTNEMLFVNCIGLRSWCDWALMQHIASECRGKCIQAVNFNDIRGVLEDTNALLSGTPLPVVVVDQPEAEGELIAIDFSGNKVVGAKRGESLTLPVIDTNKGKLSEQIQVYNIVSKGSLSYKGAQRFASSVKSANADVSYRVLAALISVCVGQRRLREAKELLFLSGNKTLYLQYATAVTPDDLVALQNACTVWALNDSSLYDMGRNSKPRLSLGDLEALFVVSDGIHDFEIDEDKFYEVYRRRSTKRLQGRVDENGELIPNKYELKPTTAPRARGLAINSYEATIQLETTAPAQVFDKSNNTPVLNCGTVSLSQLKSYRSFTLMSSGVWNITSLPVRVLTKRGVLKLQSLFGSTTPSVKKLDVGHLFYINLRNFNVIDAQLDTTWDVIKEAAEGLFTTIAATKFYSAMLNKVSVSPFTPEQATQLKEMHLTPALYWSAPTVEAYKVKDKDGDVGLESALKKGVVDTFTRYKISFGTKSILNSEEFCSANEFLQKYYNVVDTGGNKIAKPKMTDLMARASHELKPHAEARMNAAHKMMKAAFDKINFNMPQDEVQGWLNALAVDKQNFLNELQNTVLYAGCMGMLPEELEQPGVEMFSGDELERITGLKLSRDEKQGMFFCFADKLKEAGGDCGIIGIVPSVDYYTT